MLVRDVMTSPVITIDGNESVRRAVQVMNENGIGSVIVIEGREAVGIVTERDVLKFIGRGGDVEKTEVREIMSKPLKAVHPDTSLEDAVKIMIKEDIKKLPVVEGGRLIGILTMTDVVGIEPILMEKLRSLIEEGVSKKIQKYLKPYYIA